MGGVYMTCYDTLHSVGNGAFGFVRQAQRKSDGKMVRYIYSTYMYRAAFRMELKFAKCTWKYMCTSFKKSERKKER